MKTLWLGSYSYSKHQLSFQFGVDDLVFNTSIWYDVDLMETERRYGKEALDRVFFHIIAFEANKLTNLRPDIIDLGPFARYHTSKFEELWQTVQHHVWAQWRYENNLPSLQTPKFSTSHVKPVPPITTQSGPVDALALCGGGKDSLVCLRLLERAGVSYSSLQYASSAYGSPHIQHDLINKLLDQCSPMVRHRQWVFDDFTDSPVLHFHPEMEVSSKTFAETPSSLFGALPIMLAKGYRYLVLGHEKSADAPDLVWEDTGEEVNHQWGKSYEAEKMLARYIRENVVDVEYFSLLKPIHDVVIFQLLRDTGRSVCHTHSCNVKKPWCLRCSKCAYVWISMMAHLPLEQTKGMFENVNVLDLPENQIHFRQMLGLEEHTPFECIGEVEESRLAFELCRAKGMTGKAMDLYLNENCKPNVEKLDRYLLVDKRSCGIPESIAEKVFPRLDAASERARTEIGNVLANT